MYIILKLSLTTICVYNNFNKHINIHDMFNTCKDINYYIQSVVDTKRFRTGIHRINSISKLKCLFRERSLMLGMS